MELLTHGLDVCPSDWKVCQQEPSGYSRVYYIRSGNVRYQDAEQETALKQEFLYLFPASCPYQISHDPDHPIDCLWFHIDFFPYDIDRLVELDPSANPTLSNILNALLAELSLQKKRSPLLLALVEAMYHIVLRICSLRQTEAELQCIIEYMRSHFADHDLTVQRLAQHFGYTPAHLIRRFQTVVRNTPHRYLATLRLTYGAKRLLAGATVSAAANESGYMDIKTFSRAFIKLYGIPPSRYRYYYRPMA